MPPAPMRILILAPQPFYIERGTPIAVRLLAQTLGELGHEVDLLTFHEGRDVDLGSARLLRTWAPPGVHNIGPGLSMKKLVCDLAMSIKLLALLRRRRYDVIHAVEESAFMAAFAGRILGIPFVYDMDSSLPEQIDAQHRLPGPVKALFRGLEAAVIRRSAGVAAVCQALADRVAEVGYDRPVALLRDISHLGEAEPPSDDITDLRRELSIDGPILLYVGNLEPYQGIDLMLEAFARMADMEADSHLVIIGGAAEHRRAYAAKSQALDVDDRVHLVGPRPLGHLGAYLAQADVLVSPRTQGSNTPMKIYSYLDSGVPVLATRLPTHVQVLDDDVAELAPADAEEFGQAMLRLVRDPHRRAQLGRAARRRVEERHSYSAYRSTLAEFYDSIGRSRSGPMIRYPPPG